MLLLPKTLFNRFLIMIVVPILMLFIMSIYIFFTSHWSRVAYNMQSVVINEIKLIHEIIKQENEYQPKLNLQLNLQGIKTDIVAVSVLDQKNIYDPDILLFIKRLGKIIGNDFQVSVSDKNINLYIPFNEQFLKVTFYKTRIKSSTIYNFIVWTMVVAILLIVIAIIFMKNQVRSIEKLSVAAERLGRGSDIKTFKPSGAKEIRNAGKAIIIMKKKLDQKIKDRTDMLTHISHDLRTPLTRIKLYLEFIKNKQLVSDLNHEIEQMDNLLTNYLTFAKEEGNENVEEIAILQFINEIIKKHKNFNIVVNSDIKIKTALIRPNAFKRAIDNLIVNAIKYTKNKIQIVLRNTNSYIHIYIDDDGAGIAKKHRNMVFKPFVKLTNNKDSYGLGLAIVKTIIQAHGGNIRLTTSPLNGLRVVIKLPILT